MPINCSNINKSLQSRCLAGANNYGIYKEIRIMDLQSLHSIDTWLVKTKINITWLWADHVFLVAYTCVMWPYAAFSSIKIVS